MIHFKCLTTVFQAKSKNEQNQATTKLILSSFRSSKQLARANFPEKLALYCKRLRNLSGQPNCSFLTAVIFFFVCVYFVIVRKARSTYLHINLNAALSSVDGVEMFTHSLQLQRYFELIFTPKRRTKNNFVASKTIKRHWQPIGIHTILKSSSI